MNFKKEVASGIPKELPNKKNYDPNVNHAPIRDCLLYTSPSPRDISGSRMPSSA